MQKIKSLLKQATPSKFAVPHSLIHRSLAERRKIRRNINLKKIQNSGLKTFSHSRVSTTLLWNGTQPYLRDTYSQKRFLIERPPKKIDVGN